MITSSIAFAASWPFNNDLFFAWLIFKTVIIPLPIGFFDLIDKLCKASNVEWQINSKCGVSPLITHPKAMKPSKRARFLDIITGISKVPGTLIILISFLLNLSVFKDPFISVLVIPS